MSSFFSIINLLFPQMILPYIILVTHQLFLNLRISVHAINILQLISVYCCKSLFSFLFHGITINYHLFIQSTLFIFILHLCLAPANIGWFFLLPIPLRLYSIQQFYASDIFPFPASELLKISSSASMLMFCPECMLCSLHIFVLIAVCPSITVLWFTLSFVLYFPILVLFASTPVFCHYNYYMTQCYLISFLYYIILPAFSSHF